MKTKVFLNKIWNLPCILKFLQCDFLFQTNQKPCHLIIRILVAFSIQHIFWVMIIFIIGFVLRHTHIQCLHILNTGRSFNWFTRISSFFHITAVFANYFGYLIWSRKFGMNFNSTVSFLSSPCFQLHNFLQISAFYCNK